MTTPTLLIADCEDPSLSAFADEIQTLNAAEKSIEVIKLTDSLFNLKSFIETPDCRAKCKILYERAWAYKGLSNYIFSLELYLKTIECSKKEEHYDLVAKSYIAIALIHEFLGSAAECKRNLDTAKDVIDKYQTHKILPFFYVRLSSYHNRFSNKDMAREFGEKAIVAAQMYGDTRNEIDGHLLVGLTSTDFEEKIFHFERSIALFKEIGSSYGAACQTYNIVKIYDQLGKVGEAHQYIKQLGSLLEKTDKYHKGYYRIKAEYLILRKQIFEDQNIQDSVIAYSKELDLVEVRARADTDKRLLKQMEIKFAVEQEQFKTKEAEAREEILRMALKLGSVLILGLGFLAFVTYRNKKQIKQQNSLIINQNSRLSESNHKYEMLLSEVHHRVKNNLQNVISLLVLQQANSIDPNTKSMLGDISSKIQSIALIHEQLYTAGEFDKIELKQYFEELFKHFANLQNSPDQFINNVETHGIKLNLETVIPLGIICSELISNSIKYGRHNYAVAIRLVIKEHFDGEYLWEYRDQGPGFPTESKNGSPNGLGLVLIKGLVRQLNAEMQTLNDNGAVVKINFKEKITSIL